MVLKNTRARRPSYPKGSETVAGRRLALCRLLAVPESDRSIIDACIAGDARAWEELVRRYERFVYSIPIRYGLDESDAADVFQAVFAIVLRKIDSLRDVDRLPSWLARITHRECWRLTKARRHLTRSVDPTSVELAAPEESDVERWERHHLLRQALRELGGRCEGLIFALYLDRGEPNYDQLADRLGIPRGSLGPTRARCLAKLREILQEMGVDLGVEGDVSRDTSKSS